jgi:putative DNA primase/helicase
MHRTWLDGKGGKAPVDEAKKVMSGTIKTGAIRLAPMAECLGLAEGIETALRASVLFNVPVWAAISAGGMRDWEAPEGLRQLIVFGDNDENFTGQMAAYALANRLALKGIKTEVRIPAKVGTDWADE